MALHGAEGAAPRESIDTSKLLGSHADRKGTRVAHENLGHALGIRDALGVAHGARGLVKVHDLLG